MAGKLPILTPLKTCVPENVGALTPLGVKSGKYNGTPKNGGVKSGHFPSYFNYTTGILCGRYMKFYPKCFYGKIFGCVSAYWMSASILLAYLPISFLKMSRSTFEINKILASSF